MKIFIILILFFTINCSYKEAIKEIQFEIKSANETLLELENSSEEYKREIASLEEQITSKRVSLPSEKHKFTEMWKTRLSELKTQLNNQIAEKKRSNKLEKQRILASWKQRISEAESEFDVSSNTLLGHKYFSQSLYSKCTIIDDYNNTINTKPILLYALYKAAIEPPEKEDEFLSGIILDLKRKTAGAKSIFETDYHKTENILLLYRDQNSPENKDVLLVENLNVLLPEITINKITLKIFLAELRKDEFRLTIKGEGRATDEVLLLFVKEDHFRTISIKEKEFSISKIEKYFK